MDSLAVLELPVILGGLIIEVGNRLIIVGIQIPRVQGFIRLDVVGVFFDFQLNALLFSQVIGHVT